MFYYKKTITNEKIANLPVEYFNGEIAIVSTVEGLIEAKKSLTKEKIVGFDTETRPSFVKGDIHNVALMQIATLDKCYLFRLNILRNLDEYPSAMTDLSQLDNVVKVGLSLRDDIANLQRKFKFNPVNFVDLQSVVKNFGIEEQSLKKIYAIIFKKKISKKQQTSNWERYELSPKQQQYAALDAWACLQIYNKLFGTK
ncbi:MAG: 3'-5' exonuclease domain-containing protein 2 [Bacteroidales bacterium]|jgi:ribonuclease D|nr:3'-5' exonuclease domain-containing protein 2 [Bacteroidales bacterium]